MKDQQKSQPKDQDVHDPSKIQHKTPHKASIENPDQPDQPNPGKTHTIDDDPDQTLKKIPVEEKEGRGL